jgi:uncharacterized cupredoxin-like copper-binding protein
MSGRSKMVVLVAALAVATLLGVACGGGGTKTAGSPTTSPTKSPTTSPTENPTTSPTEGATAASATGATVDVILSEWVLEPDPASVPAGKVTFKANNEGTKEHEFVIFKTDLAPDALPKTADGKVDEAGAGVQHIDEIGSVLAGKSAELTVDLQPGKYVLICNISAQVAGQTELHYTKGMHAAFTVQ